MSEMSSLIAMSKAKSNGKMFMQTPSKESVQPKDSTDDS